MKRKPKLIYLLFDCDTWKSTSSMSLRTVATTENKIKQAVIRAIKAEDMIYREDLGLSKTAQVKLFKEDWDKLTRDRITDHLRFGFLDTAYDGVDI